MPAYALGGVVPVVSPDAFVHPLACLIGDVVIGPGCFVGPFATLRGDMGRIEMAEGSNLQDGCVVHCFPGQSTVIEQDGHVGHGAVLHGCRVGRGALVGMKSVVMDGAVIGAEAFVGAHSFVPAGMVVEDRWLVVGSPARPKRPLTAQEVGWKANGTRSYRQLARYYRTALREVTPLPALEPDRPSLALAEMGAVPLHEHRSR